MPRHWDLSILRITKEIALGTDGPERVRYCLPGVLAAMSAAEDEGAGTLGKADARGSHGWFPPDSGRAGYRAGRPPLANTGHF
jgi:hypothetical protein